MGKRGNATHWLKNGRFSSFDSSSTKSKIRSCFFFQKQKIYCKMFPVYQPNMWNVNMWIMETSIVCCRVNVKNHKRDWISIFYMTQILITHLDHISNWKTIMRLKHRCSTFGLILSQCSFSQFSLVQTLSHV